MSFRLTFFSAASFAVAPLLVHEAALAQSSTQADYLRDEMGPLPSPEWVTMKDQGATNLQLKGMRAPNGVQEQTCRLPMVSCANQFLDSSFDDFCQQGKVAWIIAFPNPDPKGAAKIGVLHGFSENGYFFLPAYKVILA